MVYGLLVSWTGIKGPGDVALNGCPGIVLVRLGGLKGAGAGCRRRKAY